MSNKNITPEKKGFKKLSVNSSYETFEKAVLLSKSLFGTSNVSGYINYIIMKEFEKTKGDL